MICDSSVGTIRCWKSPLIIVEMLEKGIHFKEGFRVEDFKIAYLSTFLSKGCYVRMGPTFCSTGVPTMREDATPASIYTMTSVTFVELPMENICGKNTVLISRKIHFLKIGFSTSCELPRLYPNTMPPFLAKCPNNNQPPVQKLLILLLQHIIMVLVGGVGDTCSGAFFRPLGRSSTLNSRGKFVPGSRF
jgi:hypothetical protein